MAVKLNMKNCVFENVGQLSNKAMKAYVECGACKAHSTIDANSGEVKCPKCGSTHLGQLLMGGGKPDWYRGSE